MNVLETVTFEGGKIDQWYFTGKKGTVMKKVRDASTKLNAFEKSFMKTLRVDKTNARKCLGIAHPRT
jgi:hypothetical protein